ncbi:MAG TPA: prepilin-type N-terminal cleavage/methylation domain-containing protein [Gemmataceae bacterium]|nr:prepilin-type N-terminal cleavage/methylation domain-containing protein [Gemmataceae bacterium]
MVLQHRSPTLVRRRTAFTLLEVLVVVAIILVLASVATVAVLQIQKENKADVAKIQAISLEKSLKTYMLKNDGNPPQGIQDILRYVDGNDPAKLNDPWGQPYQIGSADNGTGTVTYYVFTTNPDTGEQIRSDSKH